MKVNTSLIRKVLVAIIFISIIFFFFQNKKLFRKETGSKFDPSNFSTQITNKYLSLPMGKKFVYEARTADGIERVEIEITGKIKRVMGIETLVYDDKVYEDGELVEHTRDYLAQDSVGNIWYFGEDVDNYRDGKIINHAGAWLAGVDGAEQGLWLKANPKAGESYRQEYYKGKAEDMAEVISLSQSVTVKNKTYKSCLQTLDYSPLEPGVKEYKFYCPEVAALVLEENLTTGERLELVEITNL